VLTVREAAGVVRELRERRGWSQSDLGINAGVSRSFVADLEAGKPTVEASKLFDVFQALGFEIALRGLQSREVRW
jgi:y4mF family transcriptional regulator